MRILKAKQLLLLLAVIWGTGSLVTFAQSSSDSLNRNLNILRLFRLVDSLNKEAEKQEANGFSKRAAMLRNYLGQKTKINDETSLKINQLSKDFQQERTKIKNLIREVDKEQKSNPTDSLLTKKSEELKSSLKQLIIGSQKKFSDNFSDEDQSKLLNFVENKVLSKKNNSRPPKNLKDKIDPSWFKKVSYSEPLSQGFINGYSWIDYDSLSNEIWATSITEGECDPIILDGEHVEGECESAYVYAQLSNDSDVLDSASNRTIGNNTDTYVYASPQESGDHCVDAYHEVEDIDYNLLSTYSNDCVNIEVTPQINKIQFLEPNTNNYIDVNGTIHVLKGSSVQFRAVKQNGSGIEGTWSGTSGVSGTSDTVTATFNTTSSNSTDYKTVIVNNGVSQVIDNIIVYELTGTLTPQDNFSGRSQSDYGIAEKINLGFTSAPSLTAQQIGNLTWKIDSGNGSLNNSTTGIDQYTAPQTSGNVTLKIEIQSGPSKNLGSTYSKTIVAPMSAYMIQSPGSTVWHCQGYSSVGFFGEVRLEPKNVSFSNIFFREGGGTIISNGIYAPENGRQHDPTPFLLTISDCNITTGCKAFEDQVWTGKWSPDPVQGFVPGNLSWNIEWLYAVTGDLNPALNGQTIFTYALHYQSSDNVGTASIQKAGAGPFTKTVNAVDSNCQPN